MLDVIPTFVDGAIVCDVVNRCRESSRDCDFCENLVIKVHNWLRQTKLEYAIFDFQDEKEICPTFIKELMQLRKRLTVPFLFSGVMSQARGLLQSFNYGRDFPIFLTPEDAVRALRMQDPGITEAAPAMPVHFDASLSMTMDRFYRNMS